MMDWYAYEAQAQKKGYYNICGVDEAGRGPLAGPVFAAAVILPHGLVIEGLDDSKKISPQKREALFQVIQKEATAYSIAFATEQEIDEINILQATFLAMQRAVESLVNLGDTIPCVSVDTVIKWAVGARVTAESLVSEVETATTLPSIVVTYVDLMKHHVIGLRILDLIIAEIPRCGPVALCNVGDTVVDFLYVTLSILKILKRSLRADIGVRVLVEVVLAGAESAHHGESRT